MTKEPKVERSETKHVEVDLGKISVSTNSDSDEVFVHGSVGDTFSSGYITIRPKEIPDLIAVLQAVEREIKK